MSLRAPGPVSSLSHLMLEPLQLSLSQNFAQIDSGNQPNKQKRNYRLSIEGWLDQGTKTNQDLFPIS